MLLLFSALFSSVFFLSFIGKIKNPSIFFNSVNQFGITTKYKLHVLCGIAILVSELIILLGIFFDLYVNLIIVLMISMLSTYSLFFLYFIVNKKKIMCSCFGFQHGESNKSFSFIRNLLLILLAVIYYNTYNSKYLVIDYFYLKLLLVINGILLVKLIYILYNNRRIKKWIVHSSQVN